MVATLRGWPDYLRESAAENRFILEIQGKGEPMVLKSWRYRGNSCVESFIYAKKPKS